MIQLSHLYTTTGKTIALTIWTFAGQVEVYLYSETQWRASLGSLHFALLLHNADNLFYVPCFGGLSWATLGRLEIGNKRTSADKRVFQGLESPGKTKKGKHQINKENGSCQQESAKQQRCRKTSSTSSPGGRLKHHPREAKEGRKPQADRCALLIRKHSGSPQLCRHFGTLTAQDTWCQTLCSGSRLWLTHWESTEGPGLLPKQTDRSSSHMKKPRAGEREGERLTQADGWKGTWSNHNTQLGLEFFRKTIAAWDLALPYHSVQMTQDVKQGFIQLWLLLDQGQSPAIWTGRSWGLCPPDSDSEQAAPFLERLPQAMPGLEALGLQAVRRCTFLKHRLY